MDLKESYYKVMSQIFSKPSTRKGIGLNVNTTPAMKDKLREVIKQILIENQNRPMTRDEIKTTIPQLNFHDTITEMMQDKIVIEEFSEERQQKVYSVKSWRSLE